MWRSKANLPHAQKVWAVWEGPATDARRRRAAVSRDEFTKYRQNTETPQACFMGRPGLTHHELDVRPQHPATNQGELGKNTRPAEQFHGGGSGHREEKTAVRGVRSAYMAAANE
jgi:hypothetical protein